MVVLSIRAIVIHLVALSRPWSKHQAHHHLSRASGLGLPSAAACAAPSSTAFGCLAVHVNRICFRPRLALRTIGGALLKLPWTLALLLVHGALRSIALP